MQNWCYLLEDWVRVMAESHGVASWLLPCSGFSGTLPLLPPATQWWNYWFLKMKAAPGSQREPLSAISHLVTSKHHPSPSSSQLLCRPSWPIHVSRALITLRDNFMVSDLSYSHAHTSQLLMVITYAGSESIPGHLRSLPLGGFQSSWLPPLYSSWPLSLGPLSQTWLLGSSLYFIPLAFYFTSLGFRPQPWFSPLLC